ncbi:DegQ family serine endoprotease [Albimonas sp. CAU 1670]|uniref:DegQ family serine endoprotease n=1 Tax=Albimonas sp. CAU 1670 TaxID=3032599 RepID=UPI0023DAE0F6|nr:DegQ family serine endoprotease [Albimonas sp. CAU 1670]MDF2232529.1 DegQ family serine endoprotease [Albimonas sp. CAU 1670]
MQLSPFTLRGRPMASSLALAAALAAALIAAGPTPHALAQSTGPQPAGAPATFADLAETLSPAVVNIATTSKVAMPDRPDGPQLPENSPFRQLFPELFGERGGQQQMRPRQSLGSGFVISADGYVVTNNHVIDGADEIKVNFTDGSSLNAELVGTDPKTDVALLKVTADHDLPHVPFANSDATRVGDWVMAIGNPFGLGGSVSAGIISARNRDINAGPYDDFLQTDAAINRGNSGGPLFDMSGAVVGMNTAIISPTGGSIGIGFAVPANIVKNVVDQLQEYGSTRRGWLGVSIQEVTPDIAESLGLDKAAGALVAQVVEDGPAAESGLQNGDVILNFDGRPVDTMRDLPRMVAETKAHKKVEVEVWRKGEVETVEVELGLLEEDAPVLNASADVTPQAESQGAEALGMTLTEITPQARQDYGLADDLAGVLVEKVDDASNAAEKGLRPGDVIVEVAQEAVASPQDVEARVQSAKDQGRKSVLLLVNSRGDLRFVAVSVE